jgi:16S rRNA (guanine527-N7)-methyltransferase
VPLSDVATRIAARLNNADLAASSREIELLARYLDVLARWNRRINLTAFDLEELPEADAAIDRLIVEPMMAARFVRSSDRLAVDVGSGGGSPALPLKIARPDLRMVLIESRRRKSAFLREAIRTLDLADTSVATARADASWRPPDLAGQVDLVTLRAVRADRDLWGAIDALLRARGRLFWFVDDQGDEGEAPASWSSARPEVEGRRMPFLIVTRPQVGQ